MPRKKIKKVKKVISKKGLVMLYIGDGFGFVRFGKDAVILKGDDEIPAFKNLYLGKPFKSSGDKNG